MFTATLNGAEAGRWAIAAGEAKSGSAWSPWVSCAGYAVLNAASEV